MPPAIAFDVVAWKGTHLSALDQTLLPGNKKYLAIRTPEAMFEAIRALRIRGAPLIGIAAAYGLYIGVKRSKPRTLDSFRAATHGIADYLASSRPTAVNLAWALDRCRAVVDRLPAKTTVPEGLARLLAEAIEIHDEDRRMCAAIGRHGAPLLRGATGVLTHCNAGALATGGIGTAIGVIVTAAAKKPFTVYMDETRPLLQGARLTAWEMQQAGIDARLVTDSTAGTVMQKGLVQAAIVGADRIAANGDVANKVGTMPLAIVAKYYGVPLYVAAPTSTFDPSLETGADIPIEERSGEELTTLGGVRTAPKGIGTFTPAFDVTPAELVAAIVTERGVLRPPYRESIAALFAPRKGRAKTG